MAENYDVVIIGAGLVGLSTAYHLARKGISRVLVIEKQASWATGSSGRSAGGVRLQFSHPSSVRFSQYAVQMFRDFADHCGISAAFTPCGYLFLTRDGRRLQEMAQTARMQQNLQVPVEVLSQDQIERRFGYIEMPGLIGGTFCSEDGMADPGSVAYGFARRSQELGVTIRLTSEVIGITVEQGRATGVVTTSGPISCGHVVNAAGPAAARIGQMAGVPIPVAPYRRSIYVTGPFDGLPQNIPFILDLDTTSYLRREGRSILMGMSDASEPSSENTETDRASLEKLVATLLAWMPRLQSATVMRGWAGSYEMSPDGSAIIGPVDDRPGLYCANGFSGHGFMHAPAAGRVLSELIAGEAPFADIMPFRLERFGRGERMAESYVV